MFSEYITAALARAEYEVIDNPEPYYAHLPGLEGVWATGPVSWPDLVKRLKLQGMKVQGMKGPYYGTKHPV